MDLVSTHSYSQICEPIQPIIKLNRPLLKGIETLLVPNSDCPEPEMFVKYGGQRGVPIEMNQFTYDEQQIMLSKDEVEDAVEISNMVTLDRDIFCIKIDTFADPPIVTLERLCEGCIQKTEIKFAEDWLQRVEEEKEKNFPEGKIVITANKNKEELIAQDEENTYILIDITDL